MENWKNRLSSMFRNILTSGMGDRYKVEIMHKVMLLNFISITCVIFIVPLGIIAYIQEHLSLGLFDHFVALIIILNVAYLRKSGNYSFAFFVGISVIITLYFFLLATGGVNNTSHVWLYTFPLGSSFLLGAKRGAVATILLLFLAIIFFVIDIDSPYVNHYSKDFIKGPADHLY